MYLFLMECHLLLYCLSLFVNDCTIAVCMPFMFFYWLLSVVSGIVFLFVV